MEDIKKTVFSVAAQQFNIPLRNINEELSVGSIPQWDSLEHLNLISSLEEKFSTEFDMDELFDVETLGDFIELLETRHQE